MSDSPDCYAVVTDQPLDEAAVRAAASSPECGAVVVFEGVIRNHDAGVSVRALDYSAHPDAEKILASLLADEVRSSGVRIAAAHRIGSLRIGDVALVAVAAAPHRAEAFAAIARAVERIKAEVPIWKRQHFVDGSSEWVGL